MKGYQKASIHATTQTGPNVMFRYPNKIVEYTRTKWYIFS